MVLVLQWSAAVKNLEIGGMQMPISSEEGIISRMCRVKLFRDTQAEGLEMQLNLWFESNNAAIRDIIYQHSTITEVEVYSCMIVYT
jgi:hypothetical protein